MTPRNTTPLGNEIIFFDNFSDENLDRTNWNIRITGNTVNNEQQAYVDSEQTIFIQKSDSITKNKNGNYLVIQPAFQKGFVTPEGNTFDFTSGRIDTKEKFEFTYGSAAARIKLPAGSGLWPAFWAMGFGNWPDTGEIDIMECVGESDWVSSAIHGKGYSGEDGFVNYYYFQSKFDITEWHEYSVDWYADCMLFRVDGNLTYRITPSMVKFLGEWAFDNPKYLILNLAIGGIYPFKINGVHEPYYGLPNETVEVIKSEQAKVMIDWVRVEKLASETYYE